MVLVGAVSSDTPVLQIPARFKRTSSEYVKGVKYATQSAERLRKELKHFRGILEEVEEHLDVKVASAGTRAEMKFLQSFEESLAECKLIVARVETELGRFNDANKSGLGIETLLWPFQEKKISKIIAPTRSFWEGVHFAFNLDNAGVYVEDIWREREGAQ